jgi:hypothetical protein
VSIFRQDYNQSYIVIPIKDSFWCQHSFDKQSHFELLELFSPGVGICFFSQPMWEPSHGVGDHCSFSSSVDDVALLMALIFSLDDPSNTPADNFQSWTSCK